MYSISQQQEWIKLKRRLERDLRVLVVEVNPKLRKELENLLYRCRLSARAVPSEGQARKLVDQGHYSLVVIPEVLPGMNGTALVRQLQEQYPELDFILTTKSPSLELVAWAFDLNVRDIVRRPVIDNEQVMDQFRLAARRNVERRLRQLLLKELKVQFAAEVAAVQPEAKVQLEERLSSYKRKLGAGNRILVVEPEEELRSLSESLMMSGFSVETVLDLDEALLRVSRGDINLLVLKTTEEPGEVAGLMESINDAAASLDTVLIAPQPKVPSALQALRLGAALHLPLMPESHELLVERVGGMLYASRRKRLLDNLLVELYLALVRAANGTVADSDINQLKELTGLSLNVALDYRQSRQTAQWAAVQVTSYLEESGVIDSATTEREFQRVTGTDLAQQSGEDRRVYARLANDHFVRFRLLSSPSSMLAYLGNLSEGGLFIRTSQQLPCGDKVELDFTLELQGDGYQICCEAEVMWHANDPETFPLAPGFGVRFIDTPPEVATLLKQVVAHSAELDRDLDRDRGDGEA